MAYEKFILPKLFGNHIYRHIQFPYRMKRTEICYE